MSTSESRTLKVLFHLHPLLDTLDVCGALEIFSHALYPSPSQSSTSPPVPVFTPTITAPTPITLTTQHLSINRDISVEDAYARLQEFDILVIPGGNSRPVLEGKGEPMGLIRAWCALPHKPEGRERLLMSVCTGSLFLAEAGVLNSPITTSTKKQHQLSATTHPNYYDQLREILASKSTQTEGKGAQTEVSEDRFVVNPTDENGLKIITCGGVSSGIDGALWVVEYIAGKEAREKVERITQWEMRMGVVL